MSTQFENAPVVELIAEVRWHTSGSQDVVEAQVGTTFAIDGVNTVVEAFLARFGAECSKLGFISSERLIPAGVPTMPGQPIYRYRSPEHEGILVQAGWGAATINAVPPYKSWTAFTPDLQRILSALQVARGDEQTPFYAVSVRYINAFGDEYLAETTPSVFARDVLGFAAALPEAIESERDESEAPQFSMQIAFPTQQGLRARMVVAEGMARDETALIFDLLIGTADQVNPTADDAFAALDSAHDVAHRMFEGITRSVRSTMKPIGES